jgi:bifunctional DNA-binding transcriptional regulator/antitoxin component of YhaV-PrlF toxin-antitoxin module
MADLHSSDTTRVRVDSAGRVVIPAELRQKLAIKPAKT